MDGGREREGGGGLNGHAGHYSAQTSLSKHSIGSTSKHSIGRAVDDFVVPRRHFLF